MAGYNWIELKSNNALEAEANGKIPVSEFVKWLSSFGGGYKRCTIKDVLAVIPSKEWHHVGKRYRKVFYYSKMVMQDSDLRIKLKDQIACRVECHKLVQIHKKKNLNHVYALFDGEPDEWFSLEYHLSRERFNQQDVAILKKSLELVS